MIGGQGGASGNGGAVTVQGGTAGATTGGGGALTLQGGAGSATSGSGGNVVIVGGNAAGDGAGGRVSINAGTSVGSGTAGFITITSGSPAAVASAGGKIDITAGAGTTTGTGGVLTMLGGQGGATGTGGGVTVRAGAGGATSGAGGVLTLQGGNATAGNSAGGNLTAIAGAGFGTSTGGSLDVRGGNGGATGTGGTASVRGGVGGLTSGAGGSLNLLGGDAQSSGAGGGIVITSGAGAGTNQAGGNINITTGVRTGTGTAGTIVIKPGASSDSATFFQVQNAGAASLFTVDTTTARGFVSVALGNTASTNAVCSSLANATAPTANTVYELRDCNAAPAADYAEMYPVAAGIDYGDIVSVGTTMVNTYDTTDGNIDWNKIKGQITQLVKSSQVGQTNTIGIVSDNYGDFTSAGHNIKDQDNPMPVALNGRVPVKISASSLPILPGDYITTSTDAGKGQKATSAGMVIGKALESWTNGTGQTTIMVYVEQGYYPGPTSSVLQGSDLTLSGSATINGSAGVGGNLNVIGDTTLANLTVNGSTVFTGSLTVQNISVANITINGHIITAGNNPVITAGTAAGVADPLNNVPAPIATIDGNDTAGSITIVAGANTVAGDLVEVTFNNAFTKTPKVMINAGNVDAANLKFYRDADTGKFRIKLPQAPTAGQTYTFDYMVVQ